MTGPGFRPTHVVPTGGLPTWESPDPGRPSVPLDPLLPVQLLQRQGDWGHVLCSNGWSAWVDARRLLAVPQDPPAAGTPMARTADPRPLLLRAEETLTRYRAAVTDLADGTLDGETFGARTRGLRIGLVVDGDSLWLYDPDHGRWVYTDGTALHTHAVDTAPGTGTPSPAHPPTQVVSDEQVPAEPPKRVVPQEPAKGAEEEPAQAVGEEPGRPVAAEPTEVVPQEPAQRVGEEPGQRVGEGSAQAVGEERTEVAGGEPGRPVAEEPERAAPDEPTRVVPPGTRGGGPQGDGT
ncbi:hypothetical protein GCM10009601_26440 [Streptomyces thermospinosisporus]|uniref:Uncharacterized protein n=1 Tax=Streptomyces thermospinosisporus TaxID=161482 RepID=A0ABN1YV39_9ACTN